MKPRFRTLVMGVTLIGLYACHGGGGPYGPDQDTFVTAKFAHAGHLPYDAGPHSKGTTPSEGSFNVEISTDGSNCAAGNGQVCSGPAADSPYPVIFSVCGNPLPPVYPLYSINEGRPANGSLPPGYSIQQTHLYLPTDAYIQAVSYSAHLATNIMQVLLTARTNDDISEGIQIDPTLATGNCAPWSWTTDNLAADTADFQARAPRPLVSAAEAGAVLNALVNCRNAGGYIGDITFSTGSAVNPTYISGPFAFVIDTLGNATGNLFFATYSGPLIANPYLGQSVNFSGTISIDHPNLAYTVPSSAPLAGLQIVASPTGYSSFIGTDDMHAGTYTGYATVDYFDPVMRFVAFPVAGLTASWMLRVDIDHNADTDKQGNVGGVLVRYPDFGEKYQLTGSLTSGNTLKIAIASNPSAGSPPATRGALVLDTTTMAATGTWSTDVDGLNATFTSENPLRGCRL
jgi:hypothetical protein